MELRLVMEHMARRSRRVPSRVLARGNARNRRDVLDLARGARFWMNLRTSLDECRARGVPLAEAKRLLQQRLAVEDRGTAKKRRRARRVAESMREVLDLYERYEDVRKGGGTTLGEVTRKIEAREATGHKRGANRGR
jgi:hypothetical protein